MKQTGLAVSSLMMGLLNGNPLASDPRVRLGSSRASMPRRPGAKVILVAFFGKGNLLDDSQVKQADADVVVAAVEGRRARGRRPE